MNNQPSEFAQKIIDIADEAGLILLKYFNQQIEVEYKRDEFDPVTIADKESDVFIRTAIQKVFPEDLFLSEENELLPENYDKRVWMIDPLDGTKSFIRGSDTFSINIGLVENGVPIFGCVTIPAQNKIFYAEKDKGAYRKSGDFFERLHTSSVNEIKKSRLITRENITDIRPIEEKINQIPFLERFPGGGIGQKFCLILENQAEAHINTNRASKWDTAAGQIILEEAGGVVTDLDGKLLDYKKEELGLLRSFVASGNKKLHEEIIKELTKLKV